MKDSEGGREGGRKGGRGGGKQGEMLRERKPLQETTGRCRHRNKGGSTDLIRDKQPGDERWLSESQMLFS